MGHMKEVRPPYLAASCPWSCWCDWKGLLAVSVVEIFQRCPFERLSQWVEVTGYPLGYCQMLWLLGILPGRENSFHDNPPPQHTHTTHFCNFLHFSFSIKYQGIPGTGKHSSQDRMSSALRSGQGMGGVEMCICYN